METVFRRVIGLHLIVTDGIENVAVPDDGVAPVVTLEAGAEEKL
mgnify:CR=1 FL=1